MTKMNVSMWVLCKHMPTDQQPALYSHGTEQRHVKRSYDGTLASDLDVVLCERPLPWLDPAKLKTLSRVAKKHVPVNTDCNGASVPDRKDPRRSETASVKRNHAHVGKSAIPCPFALQSVVDVLARHRNCWLFTTRKQKVPHFSRQMLRHNKASSMILLRSSRQLLIHQLARR